MSTANFSASNFRMHFLLAIFFCMQYVSKCIFGEMRGCRGLARDDDKRVIRFFFPKSETEEGAHGISSFRRRKEGRKP